MSIYFTADTHLIKIENISGVKGMKTDRYYRIYGLKHEINNPPILIERNELPAGKDEKVIRGFLKRNGLPVEFVTQKYNKISKDIDIGLRFDVRENVYVSAAVVNALIGYFENKVDLEDVGFGIPKINNVEELEEKKEKKVLDFQTAKY